MVRVLISYRRAVDWALADRLHDALVELGQKNVFELDIQGLSGNVAEALEQKLLDSDVMITIVDRSCSSLDDDIVRQELTTALRRNITVIALLQHGTVIPCAGDLPRELAALADCQTFTVSQWLFRSDVDRIALLLERMRTSADLAYMGIHSRAAAQILMDEGRRTQWEQNYWIREAIQVPTIYSDTGRYTMREPAIEQLNRFDLTGDTELDATRSEVVSLIDEAPLANKEQPHYDLRHTPEITLLLEELDEAVAVRGKFAYEEASRARLRAYRDANLSNGEVERWRQNLKVYRTTHVAEIFDTNEPFSSCFMQRESFLELCEQLDFSSDNELDAKRNMLVDRVRSAPIEMYWLESRLYDLWVEPDMRLLRGEIELGLQERGEAALERNLNPLLRAALISGAPSSVKDARSDVHTPRVFISYRADSGWGLAGRLYEELVYRFGRGSVFIDMDKLGSDVDWSSMMEQAIRDGDAMLAVIDRNWVEARNEHGERLLESPGDVVRLELATALQRDVQLIPVLEPGARMPTTEQLPEDLESMTRRNAVDVSRLHFGADVDRILELLVPEQAGLDSTRLGVHQATAERILSNQLECYRWERNYRFYKATWVVGAVMGPSLREPLVTRLSGLDVSGDARLEAIHRETIEMIHASPIAEEKHVTKTDTVIYDLCTTPELALLLYRIDEAVRVFGKLACDQAHESRVRAYSEANVSNDEIERWERNLELSLSVFITESLCHFTPLGGFLTQRSALMEFLQQLDFSTNDELDTKRNALIEMIQSTLSDYSRAQSPDELRLTPDMKLLQEEIETAVHERGEAAAVRRQSEG